MSNRKQKPSKTDPAAPTSEVPDRFSVDKIRNDLAQQMAMLASATRPKPEEKSPVALCCESHDKALVEIAKLAMTRGGDLISEEEAYDIVIAIDKARRALRGVA